jgi:uncharacterized DUF497 family protein
MGNPPTGNTCAQKGCECVAITGDSVRISGFDWDDGNDLHLALGRGIEPEEAEELFAVAPLFRKTRRGHCAAFGRACSGRLLVVVFDKKDKCPVRVITGRDMNDSERRYCLLQRKL